MSVLAVRDLEKAFGGVRAVDDVSFDIAKGEFLALIGPNGAGKSTCFNIINGQLRPDNGDVLLEGRSIAGLPPRDDLAARRRPHLPGRGDVRLDDRDRERAARAREPSPRDIPARWPRSPGGTASGRTRCSPRSAWPSAAERACRELAYGDVKRVELAIALANDPRLLLMDEPTAGMAPRERLDMIALVKRLVTERGISVLFTEHSMDVVFAYADRIIVLARGRLIAAGSAAEIRDDAEVRAVYLGTGKTFAKAGP